MTKADKINGRMYIELYFICCTLNSPERKDNERILLQAL